MNYKTFEEAATGLNITGYAGKWKTAKQMNPEDPAGARITFLELGGEYTESGQADYELAKWVRNSLKMLRENQGRTLAFIPGDYHFMERLLHTYRPQIEHQVDSEPGFYMVHAEGGHPPIKRHQHCGTASDEARRIARKDGVTTYVLEAIEMVVPTTTLATTPLRVQPTNVTPFGPSIG